MVGLIYTHRNIEGRVGLYAGAEIVHVGVVAGVVGARVHATHRPVSLLRAQVTPSPTQHVWPARADAASDYVY